MTDLKKNSPEAESEELGFNESELQDIMSEIENLEKEFTDTHEVTPVETADARSDLAVDPNKLKIDPKDLAKNELQRQIDEELENSLRRLDGIEAEASHQEALEIEEAHDLDEVDQILDEASIAEVEMADVTDVVADSLGDSFEGMGENESVHETYYAETTKTNDNIFKMPAATPAPTAPRLAASNAPVSFKAEGSMSLTMNFKVGGSEAKLSVQGEDGLVLFFEGVEIKLSEENGCVVEMNNGIKFNIPLVTKATKRNVA